MRVPQHVLFWLFLCVFFNLFWHNGKSKPITTNQEMSQRNTTSTAALIVNGLLSLLMKPGLVCFLVFFLYISFISLRLNGFVLIVAKMLTGHVTTHHVPNGGSST